MANPLVSDPAFEVEQVFTPAIPISESTLFAGRAGQLRKAIQAIHQRGQHVVVYGERGVGKTSLANVLSSQLVDRSGANAIGPSVNCDASASFSSLWTNVLAKAKMLAMDRAARFDRAFRTKIPTSAYAFPSGADITPAAVCERLTQLGRGQLLLVIFDEFDRLTDQTTHRAMADTIKALSDHAIPATVVIVGVADTVNDLIAEHASIDRALVQIPMPRMDLKELYELLRNGMRKLRMDLEPKARRRIAELSQGLPPYTHRLALHATTAAMRKHRLVVTERDVEHAIRETVENAQESLRDNYRKAISSPQTGNLFGQVLLACARAETDAFGYFAAADVREPMSKIMGRRYEIQSFARHLSSFCQPARGNVLRKEGEKHRYRYRFNDPLMQPFVIMKGIIEGMVGT